MDIKQMKDEIISIAKYAIGASSLGDYGVTFSDNDVDNVAEDIADNLLKNGYRKICNNYKKFLFVEDGSVDVESIEEALACNNPGIKVIVYRCGGRIPELEDIKE